MNRYSLEIRGIVQGVGFRPHLYRLAESLAISGFVQNTAEGIYAEIEGNTAACDSFISSLKQHPPALTRIKSIHINPLPLQGDIHFVILESLTKKTLLFHRISGSARLVRQILWTKATGAGTMLYELHRLRASLYHSP